MPDARAARAPAPAGLRLRRPGLLRRAGGRLWWVADGCRARELDLARLALRRLAGERCRVWPAPDGRQAISTLGDLAYLLVDRRLSLLRGDPPRRAGLVVHPDGYLASAVRWSPDARSAAFCIEGLRGPSLALVPPSHRRPRLLPGRCHPAWLGGNLVWSQRGEVRSRGRTLVSARTLAAAVGGRLGASVVTAVASAGGQLAVGVARGERYGAWIGPGAVVVVDRHGRLLATRFLEDGALPLAVGVAPDGSAAWYVDGVSGDAHLFPLGRPLPSAVPRRARAFAWSPDGHWLAAARQRAVEVHGWRRRGMATIVADAARDLSWTRG